MWACYGAEVEEVLVGRVRGGLEFGGGGSGSEVGSEKEEKESEESEGEGTEGEGKHAGWRALEIKLK